MAPCTERSAAQTLWRFRVWATMIWLRRVLRSAGDSERQRIAMTSEATAMSKPDWRREDLAVLSRPDADPTECAVIHVDDAVPDDAAGINAACVAVVDVVVQCSGEQVVRRGYRVDISR